MAPSSSTGRGSGAGAGDGEGSPGAPASRDASATTVARREERDVAPGVAERGAEATWPRDARDAIARARLGASIFTPRARIST